MTDAQIAEYESLREEHMRNMDTRGALTNVMVTALATIFGLSSWFHNDNTFHVFFFVPALTAVWGYFICHSYEVFWQIRNYLLELEKKLGMSWDERNPPHPLLLAYILILLGAVVASLYFIFALHPKYVPELDIISMYMFFQTLFAGPPSIESFGWIAWLVGVALSLHVAWKFFVLSHTSHRSEGLSARLSQLSLLRMSNGVRRLIASCVPLLVAGATSILFFWIYFRSCVHLSALVFATVFLFLAMASLAHFLTIRRYRRIWVGSGDVWKVIWELAEWNFAFELIAFLLALVSSMSECLQ